MTVTESQRRQIADLHALYVRWIDDDRLNEWPELFTDYCLYRVATRDGTPLMECRGQAMLADRVTELRRSHGDEEYYSHQISALSIESFDGETAVCRSNFLVIRTVGGDMSIFAAGVYMDRIALDQGSARFEERIAVVDAPPVDTLLVVPL